MNEINQKFNTSSGNKKGPVIYLIGNKLDKLDRVITREQAEEKANFYGIKYYEISCKLNINVQEIYSRYGIEMPFYSFFVIINMMYSDMGKILGTGNDNETLIKYIEASQNWYFDEDTINTQEAKLYNYWKYVVN